MDATEAIAKVQAWLRDSPDGDRTVGEYALAVQHTDVAAATGGWHVPVNLAAYLEGTDTSRPLVPTPVMFVPADGGQLRYADDPEFAGRSQPLEAGFDTDAESTEWSAIVDSEFDKQGLADLPTPRAAVLGWEQLDASGTATGRHRVNPQYTVGPIWRGFPPPRTATESLLNYFNADWIDRATFVNHLLEQEVLLPLDEHGTPQTRGNADRFDYPVFSSSAQVIAGTTRWRRVRAGSLLAAEPRAGLVFNPGRPLEQTLSYTELHNALNGATPNQPEGPVEFSAEASAAMHATVTALTREFELPAEELLHQHLAQVAQLSRANGYELSQAELERYARGFALKTYNQARVNANQPPHWPEALPANGLVAHYDSSGEVAPTPWTYGKFFARATPDGNFAWHRLVGAYVGFAIGDAIGSLLASREPGDTSPITALEPGKLTRQLLLHTESVIRGLPPASAGGEVPSSFPPPERAHGWLATVTAKLAGPVPGSSDAASLAIALAATVAGGAAETGTDEGYPRVLAHRMLGASTTSTELTDAVDTLVWLLSRLLGREEFGYPVHVRLAELAETLAPDSAVRGLTSTVLRLRDDRAGDDTKQVETIGDGYSPLSVLGRALLGTAKRGYDPERAIRVAVNQSGDKAVAGAVAGALIGAKVGVPGLPALWVGALPELGLVENIASDAFWHFNRFGVAREPTELAAWAQRYPPA